MSSNWKTLLLGEIFEVSTKRLGAYDQEPPVFAISKYDGVVLGSDYHDRRVASEKLDSYKVLGPAEWAYSTIHIDEGAIARNNHEAAGVVSPMYTILRWMTTEHDPRYFEILLRSPKMLAVYGDMAQGSINRRRSLLWKTFSSIAVTVPDLDEQRRIVDLIACVDTALDEAAASVDAANRLLNEYLEDAHFSQRRLLGELASMRSGPSWKAANESSVPVPGGEPVLGITNTPAGRDMDLSNLKYVSGLPTSTIKITPTSIIMIRTNGNRARIGNVYRPSPEIAGFAVSAFQIIIQPADPADAAIIYWALSRPSIQRMISESASGSTGLGNIAIGWLRQLNLPYPTCEEREIFLSTCEAMLDAIKAADETSRSLRTLRSELLSALLSGAHRIPETYDELVGA